MNHLNTRRTPNREPLFRVSEIAQELGISRFSLTKLLTREGAPEPAFRGVEMGHMDKRKPFYRKHEVLKWYRSLNLINKGN